MEKRSQNVINALVFLLFLLVIFLVLKTPPGMWIRGTFESAVSGIGKTVFGISQKTKAPFLDEKTQALERENADLRAKLTGMDSLKKDNAALSDQFAVSAISGMKLTPVHIVSMPRFIPGVSLPDVIIIDAGKNAHIREGMGVVVKDSIIGKITRVSESLSEVTMVSNTHITLSGKSSRTGALGVVRGKNDGELLFDNVLPSEDVKTGDVIMSVGDMNSQGVGFPGNLILGKVASVDKKPSAIFQSAKLKSLIDVTRLSTVFVVTGDVR